MPTFNLIQSNTVSGTSTNSINFSSIPQTYTDLVLYMSVRSRTNNDSDTVDLKYNSITGYTGYRFFVQDGGFIINNSYNNGIPALVAGNTVSSATTFSHNRIQIYDYTNTTNTKPATSWGGWIYETGGNTSAKNGWHYVMPTDGESTAAITSLTLTLASSANFHADSTFYLYGIKKD